MRQICVYDSEKDLQEVDQFGFVDLVTSSAEGFIPADIGTSAENFDGEDLDPESLLGSPSDRFEAMRMQENLAEGIRNKSKKEVKKTDSYNKSEKS